MTSTISGHIVRQQFIDFFTKKHGHTEVPSAPTVPHGDPTLLFTNAGMNQFKTIFLGQEKREYTRAVDTQKCIRAGGKHNDLDDVGKDTYHHTFFEMLGNWSFGDYFKEEAIQWAWELLTEVWDIDPERLHATYFEGDASEGLEPDLEAKELWEKVLPPERVHPGNKKDNFWEMGDTGPCGPCSEIHYDGTADKTGGTKINQDDPDVIEIWNNVFIQFNRNQDGSLTSLPAKHVDTGMGLERITRILAGKNSNYDTDLFQPLFEAIREITGARTYGGDLKDPTDIAYRVLADHVRTLSFALADGAHCGNKGREAVLRAILRRAVRYGHQNLNVCEPFFYKLVSVVVREFGSCFPELKKHQTAIESELKDEEIAFRATLERGIVRFNKAVTNLTTKAVLDGETAFDLEATYGFPFGLTCLMAEERGLQVDVQGYEAARETHANISRGQSGGADAIASLNDLCQQLSLEKTEFIGHDNTEASIDGNIRLFVLQDGVYRTADSAPVNSQIALLLDRTPFYGESGGQVGDQGTITINSCCVQVNDTQRVGDVIFHLGEIQGETLTEGTAQVSAKVNATRRQAITVNHTLTHVMNRALRDCVYADTAQRGSLVDDTKTRFDFDCPTSLTPEQVQAVDAQVNSDIAANLAIHWDLVPQEQALKINGLRAVFGEKYPPIVRVVSIGSDIASLLENPENDVWAKQSTEFCGGTHLQTLGEAECFALVAEEPVAKGVRRLTAVSGNAAKVAQEKGEILLHKIDKALGSNDIDCVKCVASDIQNSLGGLDITLAHKFKLREGFKALQEKAKEIGKAAAKAAAAKAVDIARELAEADYEEVIVLEIPGADNSALNAAADVFRNKHPDSALFLAGVSADKVALFAAVPKSLQQERGLKAGDWIKAVAPIVGGGGGGRPDTAQAGGKDPAKLAEALEKARALAGA